MMHFQSENHSDQVLAAVQSENGCDILLIGNDNVSSHSDNLWILSPLVRSIIDSLGNIRDNLIILPDFSSEDIKTGLEITEGNKGEVLRFNSTTKHLLETLGLDLSNSWSVVRENSDKNPNWEIKTESTEELLDSSDDDVNDDEDDIQKLLLAQNPDFDSSDEEEDTEEENVTVDELPSIPNIKQEKSDIRDRNRDVEQNDEDDIQDQLINDQDMSDSDDDESLTETTDLKEKMGVVSDEEIGADTAVNTRDEEPQSEKILIKGELSANVGDEVELSNETREEEEMDTAVMKTQVADLQQQKLKEVEELLVAENGRWKCRECGTTASAKFNLRAHAEIHVSGLSFPCNQCSEILPTRKGRAQHKKRMHGSQKNKRIHKRKHTVRETNKVKNQNRKNKEKKNQEMHFYSKTRQIIHNEKLKEVESLLVKDDVLWKCRVCSKTFKEKSKLRIHAETHVKGLSYQCKKCTKIYPTQYKLWNHVCQIQSDDSKSSPKLRSSL